MNNASKIDVKEQINDLERYLAQTPIKYALEHREGQPELRLEFRNCFDLIETLVVHVTFCLEGREAHLVTDPITYVPNGSKEAIMEVLNECNRTLHGGKFFLQDGAVIADAYALYLGNYAGVSCIAMIGELLKTIKGYHERILEAIWDAELNETDTTVR